MFQWVRVGEQVAQPSNRGRSFQLVLRPTARRRTATAEAIWPIVALCPYEAEPR